MNNKLLYIIGLIVLTNSCKNKSRSIVLQTNKVDTQILSESHSFVSETDKIDTQLLKEYAEREKKVFDFLAGKKISFLNDTAKWYLYNIYCDYRLPKSIIDTPVKIYLSYLPLRPLFYSLTHNNKHLEIYYSFMYNSLRAENFPHDSDGYKIVNGVRFNLKTKKIIDFINGRGSFRIVGSKSRFETLMQPEIPVFVNNNKDKINEWYKKELIKHKVLDK